MELHFILVGEVAQVSVSNMQVMAEGVLLFLAQIRALLL